MTLRSLDDLLSSWGGAVGRSVLLRADLNVPLRDGAIADDARIRASLPTLQRLLSAEVRVILCSHLGRPGGAVDSRYSLRPVADHLAELLDRPVAFAPSCVGETAHRAAASLRPGEVLLLENLRFEPGETQDDPTFAATLAALADSYVNDAFGVAHRSHASTVGIPRHLSRCAAGNLLLREIESLQRLFAPERPFLCLLGGAKVSDKIGIAAAMARRADCLAVGGAMAYTFLATLGMATGRSLVEETSREAARSIVAAVRDGDGSLLLPEDHVVARELAAGTETRVVRAIPEQWIGVDIGPATADRYSAHVARARTVFWNGPMGAFEIEPFAAGTLALAHAVAGSTAYRVVGGGDSLAALHASGLADRIDHCSTGGGASLAFLEGRTLPALAALES